MPLYREDYDMLGIQEPLEVVATTNMYIDRYRAERRSIKADLSLTSQGELKLELDANDIDLANPTLIKVIVPGGMADNFVAYLRNKGFTIKVDDLIVKVDRQTVVQGLVRFRYGQQGELESDVEVLFVLSPNLWAQFVESLRFPAEWEEEP